MAPSESPYRAAPSERPVIRLRDATAPLGVGVGLAFVLLFAGLGASITTVASELLCARHRGVTTCTLVTHHGLFRTRRPLDVRGLDGITTTADPDLPLESAAELLDLRSDGHHLALPTRGIYHATPRGLWAQDDQLEASARRWFADRDDGTFTVLQHSPLAPSWIALALALACPIAGVGLVLLAERKTRALTLTLDPNARTAHARSVGLGGRALDRTHTFGADPSLTRFDDAGPTHLPLVRVSSTEGTSLPLLTGHAPEHREAFDRLVARANRCLAERCAADPSPSLAMRLAPSLFVALACLALVARVGRQLTAIPPTEGTLEISASTDRCEAGGMTLRRGASVAWGATVGIHPLTFTVAQAGRRDRTVTLRFEVQPGTRTAFDCGAIANCPGANEIGVTPLGVQCGGLREERLDTSP